MSEFLKYFKGLFNDVLHAVIREEGRGKNLIRFCSTSKKGGC